jgi:hypothetical protein
MNDDMLPEYDFTGKTGVRGKYYQQLRNGYTIEIHQEDGSVQVQQVTPGEGMIMLDPDVREYFPDAASVNHALRTLIRLVPPKRKRRPAKAAGG